MQPNIIVLNSMNQNQEAMLQSALRMVPFPTTPVTLSNLEGPQVELRRVTDGADAGTAVDVRILAGFRCGTSYACKRTCICMQAPHTPPAPPLLPFSSACMRV